MTSKYRNIKCEYKGIKFDSKKEMERYIELKDLESRGGISDLECQVPFDITDENDIFKPIKYIADFGYFRHYPDKKIYMVEDVKGMKKGAAYSLFKLKKALMYEKYKILVVES